MLLRARLPDDLPEFLTSGSTAARVIGGGRAGGQALGLDHPGEEGFGCSAVAGRPGLTDDAWCRVINAVDEGHVLAGPVATLSGCGCPRPRNGVEHLVSWFSELPEGLKAALFQPVRSGVYVMGGAREVMLEHREAKVRPESRDNEQTRPTEDRQRDPPA